MRILHCLRAPIGGLFRHVLDLAAEQARRGHDVGLLADSNAENSLTSGKFAEIAPLMTLGLHRTPMSRQPGLGDLQALMEINRYAGPLELDVLHGHGAKGGAYARLAARGLRRKGRPVKVFYTPHGGVLNFDPQTIEGRVLLGAERMLEGLSSGLIFESAYAAGAYAKRVRPPRVPARIIPNGLQPADFRPVVSEDAATDVLFLGELRDLKGVHLLIDALSALNKKRRVTATVVGAGPDADTLKEQTARLGLKDAITFTGALPARQAFALGRIMVVPSLAESFPYVVLEAAAAGLPLIATAVGGIPEIVDGTDTELIAPNSVNAIIASLHANLDDPSGAAARAGRLRDNVAAKFTVGGMADSVLDFYTNT